MLYAWSGMAIRQTNGIVQVRGFLGGGIVASEDEAFGICMKKLLEDYPQQEGWDTHLAETRCLDKFVAEIITNKEDVPLETK